MLRDILLDWILFGIVESFVFTRFIVGHDTFARNCKKFISFVCLLGLFNTIVCFTLDLIGMFMMKHAVALLIVPYIISKKYHLKFKNSIIKMCIIYGVIFIIENLTVFIIMDVLNINFVNMGIINKFIFLLPAKLIEILFCIRGDSIMKFVWGSIERR